MPIKLLASLLPKNLVHNCLLIRSPDALLYLIAISGFPDFEQFYTVGFPMGTQVA
jgi:hypothetical protein